MDGIEEAGEEAGTEETGEEAGTEEAGVDEEGIEEIVSGLEEGVSTCPDAQAHKRRKTRKGSSSA